MLFEIALTKVSQHLPPKFFHQPRQNSRDVVRIVSAAMVRAF
jgi:hypothetical protein